MFSAFYRVLRDPACLAVAVFLLPVVLSKRLQIRNIKVSFAQSKGNFLFAISLPSFEGNSRFHVVRAEGGSYQL